MKKKRFTDLAAKTYRTKRQQSSKIINTSEKVGPIYRKTGTKRITTIQGGYFKDMPAAVSSIRTKSGAPSWNCNCYSKVVAYFLQCEAGPRAMTWELELGSVVNYHLTILLFLLESALLCDLNLWHNDFYHVLSPVPRSFQAVTPTSWESTTAFGTPPTLHGLYMIILLYSYPLSY